MPSTWASRPFVTDTADGAEEPMGSKEKLWVPLPGDERQWLLKVSRIDDHDGTVSGEDWAEWAVHQLAGLIGIPSAEIAPATLDGRRAIISRSVLHDARESLDYGNSVLSAKFPGYGPSIRGENPGYTPVAVRESLAEVLPPSEVTWPEGFTAYDVWAGYLVMDAWVAGRDRHHENWAVVLRGDERRLAPSFDHGNALGFQERDEKRKRMLADEAHLLRWVERGKSRHFAGQPVLIDLASSALDVASSAARDYWFQRLDAVADGAVHAAVSAIPGDIMSEVTRTFVVRLLATNRRRLLDGYSCS